MEDDLGGEDFSTNTKKSAGKLKLKLESVIPILVIIAVVLLIVFKSSIIGTGNPLLKQKGSDILIVGSPSPGLQAMLENPENRDLVKQYRTMDTMSLQHNPRDRLKNYDIIILDQSMSSDKSIPRTVGEAISNFVKSGGKLIVVLNSGIERPNDVSVLGWKATFGDIIPVTCDPTLYNIPSCKKPFRINGVIYSAIMDHEIVYGIERVPSVDSLGLLSTETYNVSVNGTEIAYIQDQVSGTQYPAIVEKPLMLGKVIYFNYSPELSEPIFVNTLDYLK